MSREQKQEKFGKAKYKVGFLGYFDVSWLYGKELTDSALRDLLYGGAHRNEGDQLPRLNITVDKKGLKITQTLSAKHSKKKVRFPGISIDNVFYASQGSSTDIEGIVGCIFYDPNNSGPKSWPLTVHGYLLESTRVANRFARHVQQLIGRAEHLDMLLRKEKEMVEGGLLLPHAGLPPGQYLMSRNCSDEERVARGPGDVKRRLAGTSFLESDLEMGSQNTDDSHRGSLDTDSGDSSSSGRPMKGPSRLPRTTLVFQDGDHNSQTPDAPSRDGRQAPGVLTTDFEPNHRRRPGSWTQECSTGTSGDVSVQVSSTSGYEDDGGRYPVGGGEESITRVTSGHNHRLPRTRPTSSLAAEFKSKLGQGPILLPPKDYDTFSRTRGNMAGIEERKCLNPRIVGSE